MRTDWTDDLDSRYPYMVRPAVRRDPDRITEADKRNIRASIAGLTVLIALVVWVVLHT